VERKLFLRKTEEYVEYEEHEDSGKLAKLCHKCELCLKKKARKKSMKRTKKREVAKAGGFERNYLQKRNSKKNKDREKCSGALTIVR
jgi:hypothetical protein